MDFSWVRQLADQSNQHEIDKQEKVTEGAGLLTMKLDELGVDSSVKLIASVEGDPMDMQKKEIVWTLRDEITDGPKLITVCQNYFTEFIKRTNE